MPNLIKKICDVICKLTPKLSKIVQKYRQSVLVKKMIKKQYKSIFFSISKYLSKKLHHDGMASVIKNVKIILNFLLIIPQKIQPQNNIFIAS